MDVLETLNSALTDRYRIEREIGRGGMATVYLARDLRHDRRVAVKVLDPELGAVLGAERFFAEIRVTANLQHPNLLPLFDSGRAGDLLFYVMPYVEGESLAARIEREKQLPVDEAVRIASAIASALDYAHRHGVIHRDLKPANVLLNEGQPLVADFGIALAVANAGGSRVTQTGISLGTPQYMSPEQATGDRVIDGRTDLYSLGAVLYEMLTGDPPHVASTAQAIIARVLTDRPRDVRVSRPSVPPHVVYTVDHALEKLPADRFATGQEMVDALSGRGPASSSSSAAGAAALRAQAAGGGSSRIARWLPWLVAAGAVAFASVAIWRSAPPRQPVVVEMQVPDSLAPRIVFARGRMVGISRDGSQLAWVGPRGAQAYDATGATQLYLRSVASPVVRPIAGTDGANCPDFSPDGRWLTLIRGQRQLYKLSLAGGSPIVLADSLASCASWGDDGSIVYERIGGSVWRVSSDGGPRSLVAVADTANGERLVNPDLLPGGRYAIVTVTRPGGERHIARLRLSDGRVERLGLQGYNGRYSRTGHLLYATADGILMAARMSRDGEVTGVPEQVTTNVTVQPGGSAGFSVSGEGTLLVIAGQVTGKRRAVRVDSAGVARLLLDGERFFAWPRVSPDGQRVAFEVGDAVTGAWDQWLFDTRSATFSRLTTGGGGSRTAGWTSDGRKVVFLAGPTRSSSTITASRRFVVALPWDRSGPPDTLYRGTDLQQVAVGPAHGYLAVAVGASIGQTRIIVVPLDTPSASRPITTTSAHESGPRLSPDGRWLAFTSNESGVTEVYATSVAMAGPRMQISTDGGTDPVWDRRGATILYRGPRRMMRATLALSPELRMVQRDSLFEDRFWRGQTGAGLDVFPSGGGFLMFAAEQVTLQTILFTDWPQLLSSRNRR